MTRLLEWPDDLPSEIIHEILLYVPPDSVLPFALTCHHNYTASLPTLYRRLTLDDGRSSDTFLMTKMIPRDPCLVWIQELRIARGWSCYIDLARLISTFPMLQSLDIVESRIKFMGWIGFLDGIRYLPPTLVIFKASVHMYNDAAFWDADVCVLFSSYLKHR